MPERPRRIGLHSGTRLEPPSDVALVVVDLQNDYCSPEGAYGASGADLSMMPPVISRSASLIDAARRTGVLVVWLQQTALRGGRSAAPSALRSRNRYLAAERCVDGTFGHAFVYPLDPGPEEPVVRKLRSSGFVGTMLDQVLDANGIRGVVLVGVGTEGCVEATARSAVDHNYGVVVVEDCVASVRMDLHACSLRSLRSFATIVQAEVLIRHWESVPFAGGLRPRAASRVHDTLPALLRPEHTALVIVESGTGPAADLLSIARAARRAGVLVVRLRPSGSRRARPTSTDLLMLAPRLDGFEGTPLHLMLDERTTHTVVLAGAEAHAGVESTARGAVHRNYHVVCIEDAITDGDPALRAAAMAVMRQRYDVVTRADLGAVWCHRMTAQGRSGRVGIAG